MAANFSERTMLRRVMCSILRIRFFFFLWRVLLACLPLQNFSGQFYIFFWGVQAKQAKEFYLTPPSPPITHTIQPTHSPLFFKKI